ncbi:MAG: hypothetical protein LBS20_05535 [Prevotella sp.]|jgi:hypothetical protein|nr:hypothetical protein [Prevotella sp.]
MRKIEKGDYIQLKSKYSPNVEHAMILDLYDIKDGGHGIHFCTPRNKEQINSLMDQTYMPIDSIEWYKHFESLEDIRQDMKDTGFLTPHY